MRRHPANKIMQTHYHPRRKKYGPDAVPKILGLTASPIRSNENELAVLEANLDAVCKTPRVNRTELLECVHRPHLHRLIYNLPKLTTEETIYSDLLIWLESCVDKYNIHDDPYIDFLRQNPDTLADAQELAISGKTFCKEQLDKFLERSMRIFLELGGWATDFFIEESIMKFRDSIENENEFSEINRSERLYLLEIFSGMPACKNSGVLSISPKLATLIDYLVEEDDRSGISAIIFAQTRAVVTVLARVLSIHPKMQDHFRAASYVGWSSYQNRSDALGDIASRDIQRDTLAEFRTGKKNLIVATDVLEEGLDISSCRLVVCFDRPANLKSFVQRRGRARRQESTYAIMSSTKDELDVAKWQELESLMIRTYQDDERQRKEAERLENLPEEVERRFFVSSTK